MQPDTPVSRAPLPGRQPAGAGWHWITAAFRLVREQPLTWILLSVVYVVIHVGTSLLPLIGNFLPLLLAPIFAGSFVLAARKAENGGELELADLFTGFREHGKPLFGVALVYLALCMIALMVVIALVALLGSLGWVHKPEGDEMGMGTMLLFMLVVGVPVYLVSLAYWFAPALVVFDGYAPIAACRASFSAGLANWPAMLTCALMLALLMFLAMLPFFLGLLLWFPVMYVTSYTSYRAVFAR